MCSIIPYECSSRYTDPSRKALEIVSQTRSSLSECLETTLLTTNGPNKWYILLPTDTTNENVPRHCGAPTSGRDAILPRSLCGVMTSNPASPKARVRSIQLPGTSPRIAARNCPAIQTAAGTSNGDPSLGGKELHPHTVTTPDPSERRTENFFARSRGHARTYRCLHGLVTVGSAVRADHEEAGRTCERRAGARCRGKLSEIPVRGRL